MKLNRKLLVVASVIATLSSPAVFAKTEGNYIGVDFLRSSSDLRHRSTNYTSTDEVAPIAVATSGKDGSDRGYGVGLNYKYAFNFNNFFVAPGAFIERNALKVKNKVQPGATQTFVDNLNINHREGLKLDLGYDINDKFAAYVSGGLSRVSYRYDAPTNNTAFKNQDSKKSGSDYGYFYGLGLGYNHSSNLAFNFEYNKQNLNPSLNSIGGDYSGLKLKADLAVFKLGASYRF